MTAQANTPVVLDGGFTSGNVMRIVARCAHHRSAALLKTGRAAQAVGCVCDLEFVVMARSFSLVEVEGIFAQRLTGLSPPTTPG